MTEGVGSDLCLPHMADPPREREYFSCDSVPARKTSGTLWEGQWNVLFADRARHHQRCVLPVGRAVGQQSSPALQLVSSLSSLECPFLTDVLSASALNRLLPVTLSDGFLFFTISLCSIFNNGYVVSLLV